MIQRYSAKSLRTIQKAEILCGKRHENNIKLLLKTNNYHKVENRRWQQHTIFNNFEFDSDNK
jgi:hypothetical protein